MNNDQPHRCCVGARDVVLPSGGGEASASSLGDIDQDS